MQKLAISRLISCILEKKCVRILALRNPLKLKVFVDLKELKVVRFQEFCKRKKILVYRKVILKLCNHKVIWFNFFLLRFK